MEENKDAIVQSSIPEISTLNPTNNVPEQPPIMNQEVVMPSQVAEVNPDFINENASQPVNFPAENPNNFSGEIPADSEIIQPSVIDMGMTSGQNMAPMNSEMAAVPEISNIAEEPMQGEYPKSQPIIPDTTPSSMPTEEVVPPTPEMESPQQTTANEEIPPISTDSVNYNQIYESSPTTNTQETSNDNQNANQYLTETPIVFEEDKKAAQENVDNFIPSFDASVLEDDVPEEMKLRDSQSIHSLMSDTQLEKEQHRKNIRFIVILFAVLIIAVLVIFPIMLGI